MPCAKYHWLSWTMLLLWTSTTDIEEYTLRWPTPIPIKRHEIVDNSKKKEISFTWSQKKGTDKTFKTISTTSSNYSQTQRNSEIQYILDTIIKDDSSHFYSVITSIASSVFNSELLLLSLINWGFVSSRRSFFLNRLRLIFWMKRSSPSQDLRYSRFLGHETSGISTHNTFFKKIIRQVKNLKYKFMTIYQSHSLHIHPSPIFGCAQWYPPCWRAGGSSSAQPGSSAWSVPIPHQIVPSSLQSVKQFWKKMQRLASYHQHGRETRQFSHRELSSCEPFPCVCVWRGLHGAIREKSDRLSDSSGESAYFPGRI